MDFADGWADRHLASCWLQRLTALVLRMECALKRVWIARSRMHPSPARCRKTRNYRQGQEKIELSHEIPH